MKTTTNDDDLPRMGTTGSSTDSRTASADTKGFARITNTPWVVTRDTRGRVFEVTGPCHEHPNCGKTVAFRFAHSWANHDDDCPCEANASLIAAAPELLAALKEVEAHHATINARNGRNENRSRTLHIVRAAIAKATGAQP